MIQPGRSRVKLQAQARGFLATFAVLHKANNSFVMSVHLHATTQLPHWTDFQEI
jgi:hypothetical protein